MSDEGSVPTRRPVAGRILLLVALIALTVLVVSRFTDLRQFIATLSSGNWTWIAAGLAVHAVFFYSYAFLYKLGFGIVGVPSRTNRMFPLVFAAIFINAVLPTGGTGAAALFIDDAARRGHAGGRAAVGVILVLIADLATLTPFLVWGLLFLGLRHRLAYYDAIGVAIFVLYIAVLIGMVLFAHRKLATLQRLLGRLRGLINRIAARFRKPDLISETWPARTAGELCEAAHAMVEHPTRLAALAGWATVVHAINALGIWALVRAFSASVPIGGLVAVFGIAVVFFIVSPVPQGIAVVEAVITLVLTSLGVGRQTAVTIAVLFRGANFWFPLLVGMWFAWRLRGFGERPAAVGESEPQAG